MAFLAHLNPFARNPPADISYPPQPPFSPTLDPAAAKLALHTPFQPHSLLTLTLLPPHPAPKTQPPAPVAVCVQPTRPRHPPSTTSSTASAITTTTTLFITHNLTRTVAVALDPTRAVGDPARYVLKLYYTTPASLWRRAHELDAYAHLACLQGAELPWYFGEYAAAGMPRGGCSVVVLEMILPGTTVAALMARLGALPVAVGDAVEDRQARWERAQMRLRVMELHSSATRAVDRVEACAAGHHGLGGANMVVSGTGRGGDEEVVVMVGWGSSMVEGVRGGWRGEWWSGVHAAFLEGGGEGEGWG